jgi:hypothetical protein
MQKKLGDPNYTLSTRKSYNLGSMEESKADNLTPGKPSPASDGSMKNEMWTDLYAP